MRLARPRTREASENILPMINLVFLLLIFFMLAGAIQTSDLYQVEPPTARGEAVAERTTALLLIDRQGRLAFDNLAIDQERLRGLLEARLAETRDLAVYLKADARVPAARVVEIMELLRAAGLERLILLTLEPSG